MNRSMIKAAAAVCVLSLLTAVAPLSAGAAEWINLSSWAYAEVSGFVSDGLLPERLKDESDYTRVMTRGEFAEVVYSVLYDTGRLQEDKNSEHFGDCFEYPDINRLYSYIYEALINDSVYDEENRLFYPELPITRSDAAVILYSALENIGLIDYGSGVVWLEEEDAAEFLEEQGLLASDLNGLSVKVQAIINTILESEIMSGTGGGSFEPDKPLTIEQGIAAAYRLYKAIPRLIYSDDEGIEDKTEQLIQTYDCGLSEFYRDKNYIIADGEKELLKLESDIYSKLFCCEYGGKKLVFAVNFNDKTDVYDPETGSVLYTIPYIVYDFNTEKGWVYVYSSRFMPAYSGLYSMAGTELIAPEYSEKEISEIAANGFIVPREERRAADGWIYYANWNDNGHLYKIDSNGENEQLLVGDSDCTNTRYLDGIIYYNVNDDDFSLRCVDENGGSRYVISDTRASLYAGYTVRFWTEDLPEDSMEYYVEQRDSYGNKLTNDYFTDFYRSRQGLGCFGGYLLYSEEADYTRTIVYFGWKQW